MFLIFLRYISLRLKQNLKFRALKKPHPQTQPQFVSFDWKLSLCNLNKAGKRFSWTALIFFFYWDQKYLLESSFLCALGTRQSISVLIYPGSPAAPAAVCSVTHHCCFTVRRGVTYTLERGNDAGRNVWFGKGERKDPGSGLRGKLFRLTKCAVLVLVLI